MSILKVSEKDFQAVVLDSEKPVIVDFFADWCGPCQLLAPRLHELAEEHPEIVIAKINVDDDPALARTFGIVSITTIVAVKGGEVVGTSVGLVEKDKILSLLGI